MSLILLVDKWCLHLHTIIMPTPQPTTSRQQLLLNNSDVSNASPLCNVGATHLGTRGELRVNTDGAVRFAPLQVGAGMFGCGCNSSTTSTHRLTTSAPIAAWGNILRCSCTAHRLALATQQPSTHTGLQCARPHWRNTRGTQADSVEHRQQTARQKGISVRRASTCACPHTQANPHSHLVKVHLTCSTESDAAAVVHAVRSTVTTVRNATIVINPKSGRGTCVLLFSAL